MTGLLAGLLSFDTTMPVRGLSHTFYRYPATTSPEIPRELIGRFSQPGDVVLDPFVGGGTTVVEALAAGRRAIGVDVNPLALLVTRAKTTALSRNDVASLQDWVAGVPFGFSEQAAIDARRTRNLPSTLVEPLSRALASLGELPTSRQRRVARCALLNVGRWAVETARGVPDAGGLQSKLEQTWRKMEAGLADLATQMASHGARWRHLETRRTLVLGSAASVALSPRLADFRGRVRLIVTSPPYPGVHVLYHRWQVHGRSETGAAYWIARCSDGRGPAYYTMGGRSKLGVSRYFDSLETIFESLRPLLAPDAVVLQTVAFSDMEAQYPLFLRAMAAAGYTPANLPWGSTEGVRLVPNRRWYVRGIPTDSGIELLVAHRPQP